MTISLFKRKRSKDDILALKIIAFVFIISFSITALTGYSLFSLKYGGTAEGRIIHSMIEEKDKCFLFQYEYTVKGQTYIGSNIDGIGYRGRSKGCYWGTETADSFLHGKYAAGENVTVSYIYAFPSVATLNARIGVMFYTPLILTIISLLFFLGIAIKGIQRK